VGSRGRIAESLEFALSSEILTAEERVNRNCLRKDEDREITEWPVRLSSGPSEHFLCALSNAVLKADEEDYSIIRPA
jgi:hypothetical protein